MTMVANRKTKMRAETSAHYRGRPLMVTVEPHEIIVRQKGKRTAFAVPLIAIFEMGCKLAAMERRREKLLAKKARKAS